MKHHMAHRINQMATFPLNVGSPWWQESEQLINIAYIFYIRQIKHEHIQTGSRVNEG